MKVCPTLLDTCSKTARGRRSVALPAENGTMIFTVLVGQVCASDGWTIATMNTNAAAVTRKRSRDPSTLRQHTIMLLPRIEVGSHKPTS
jgi:hypothetical protein